MGGLDGFDGFFDDFFDEEEFNNKAKLIESKTIEKNGESYTEEVWKYGDTTVTKTYINIIEDSEDSDNDLNNHYQKLIDEMQDIREEIKEAVDKENYERAAELKTRLKQIENFINKE